VQHIRKVLQQRKQFLQAEIKLAKLLDTATAQGQILEQLQVVRTTYAGYLNLQHPFWAALLNDNCAVCSCSILASCAAASH
jgi:hypothetical protein